MSNLNQDYDKKKKELQKGANDMKDSVMEGLSDARKAAMDKASDINKEALGFVKEKPYIALASALIAGWVIAKILL